MSPQLRVTLFTNANEYQSKNFESACSGRTRKLRYKYYEIGIDNGGMGINKKRVVMVEEQVPPVRYLFVS